MKNWTALLSCQRLVSGFFKGLDAPENTLKAAKNAKCNGAKCVHFDVAFTSDGVAVVSARNVFMSLRFGHENYLDAFFSSRTSAKQTKIYPTKWANFLSSGIVSQ
jgi:glycerophosphoryl diester phosphodiesterase